jgi:release factor glutamine methyltransferase
MNAAASTGDAALVFGAGDTLQSAYAKLVRAFSSAGLETPDVDARYLLRGVLKIDAGAMLRTPEQSLGDAAHLLTQAALRRLHHEPVSRILGEREFYGRLFEVTPDVLDPRPDTETLVDEVLALVDRKGWRGRALRIADIGLGSGAILVTLLAELPLAQGVGTDVSAAALACAKRNAARNGVADRLCAVQTGMLNGVTEPFDIVVSNPPYICSREIGELSAEVRNFDPILALDGGADGLVLYREICRQINGLDHSPCVVVEVGAGQDQDVAAMFEAAVSGRRNWVASFRKDLGGHVRCVTFERQC